MKKIIVVSLLIALIFSVTNFALANSTINLWFLPEQSGEVKGEIEATHRFSREEYLHCSV